VVASHNPSPDAPVHVQVPAREDFVPVLRTVTTAVTGRASLPFDDIADVRLLVDEASAHVLAVDDGQTSLALELRARRDGVEALVWSDGRARTWPPEDLESSLGWRVLSALADEVEFVRHDGGPAIRIRKRAHPNGRGR
jgi:anti-sigma regulatory factor (Ser/Thr protein kinase)